MKKIMFAAIAALAITSCSQNEEFEAPSQKAEISFNTAVTRATVLITNNFKTFTAYGYAHSDLTFSVATAGATEILKGVFAKGDDSKWTNDDKFYWPADGKVAFFAYSPAVTDGGYVKPGTGYPTVKYTVENVIADQADFVVAQADQEKSASVALSFKHALTQVLFNIKGDDSNLTYTVTALTLEKIKNVGTYNFETNAWTPLTGDATYNIPTSDLEIAGITPASLVANNQLMILMPQELSADAKVSVTYTAKNTDTGVVVLKSTIKSAQLTGTWGTGDKYAYTLVLTGGEKIELSGTVEDNWTDKNGGDVKPL